MENNQQRFSPLAFIVLLVGATATLAWTGVLLWGLVELTGLL
jgi:hypothetical protein